MGDKKNLPVSLNLDLSGLNCPLPILKTKVQFLKIKSKVIEFLCSCLGLFLVLLCLFIYNKEMAYPGFYALLPVVATSLIIYANTSSFLNNKIFITNK